MLRDIQVCNYHVRLGELLVMAFSVCKTLLQTGFKTHLNEKRTLNSHWWPWSSYREYVSYIYIYILVSYNPSSYIFRLTTPFRDIVTTPPSIQLPFPPRFSEPGDRHSVNKIEKEVIWMNGALYMFFFVLYQVTLVFGWYCKKFFGLILFVTNRVETFSIIWVLHNIQFQ